MRQKSKVTCLSENPTSTRGKQGGGAVRKKVPARGRKSSKPSKVVHLRRPLQEVDENSVDSGSESDQDFMSGPSSKWRTTPVSHILTQTGRSDASPKPHNVLQSRLSSCVTDTESSLQTQTVQESNDEGGCGQDSTQSYGYRHKATVENIEESQNHNFSSNYAPGTSTITQSKIGKDKSSLSQASTCKLSAPFQNVVQTFHHFQESQSVSTDTQSIADSFHQFHDSPKQPPSNPTSLKVHRVAKLPQCNHVVDAPKPLAFREHQLLASTAATTPDPSRTCLKGGKVCDLSQMVSTMNIEDNVSRFLTSIDIHENSGLHLSAFQPNSASTPYTRRITRHRSVHYTPLTSITRATLVSCQGPDSTVSDSTNSDVTILAPETPPHLMQSLQRRRLGCRGRSSSTGEICVIDDTFV